MVKVMVITMLKPRSPTPDREFPKKPRPNSSPNLVGSKVPSLPWLNTKAPASASTSLNPELKKQSFLMRGRQYIEMIGGQITVQSELGKGTTFIFTLSIADK